MSTNVIQLKIMVNTSWLTPGLTNTSNTKLILDSYTPTVVTLELIYIPLICLFGLFGNTLSAITFCNKSLRKASCSVFLTVRSVSDNGFLVALLLTWISSIFHLQLSGVRGICQIILLLTYIPGCVSVWIVVFVTIENYIRICHPFVVNSISSPKPARILISILCLCAFSVYHIPLWIANPDCTHNQKFCDATQALVYTDTLLTLVIPSLVIILLMSAILWKIVQPLRLFRHHAEEMSKPNRKVVPAAKITKMLLIVSVMFFFLNFPSHVIRLYILLNSFVKGHDNISATLSTIQILFHFVYYSSFSVNILIYVSFGKNFRNVFKGLFCEQLPGCSERRMNEAINLVPIVQLRQRYSSSVNSGSRRNAYLSVPNSA